VGATPSRWCRQRTTRALHWVASTCWCTTPRRSPSPDFAYSTVKAALIAYAKKLAIAHGATGVGVNSIAPGSIDFPGGTWDRVKQHQPGLYQRVCSAIPTGRMGTPEEVADVAVFLCSPRAGWITGECVAVDGGQHKAMR
jgi:3-oxoacyl-[acyl-carrier protein] reductase